MFKTMMINLLLSTLSTLLNGDLLNFIKRAVVAQMSSDLPGDQKRDAVMVELMAAKGELGRVLAKTSVSLINLGIEASVVWAKNRLEKERSHG